MAIDIHPQDAKTIWSKEWRMQNLYKIRTEDKRLVFLLFNSIQRLLFDNAISQGLKGIRDLILKARKEGVTTFWSLFYLDETIFIPNTTTCIIAHRREDVQKIFKIVKLAYRECPNQIECSSGRIWKKPVANYDNKNELVFDEINSAIFVALDGRGGTINNLHISEASKIPENVVEERMAAIMESVPNIDLGSNITIESTSNGMGGWFHDQWNFAVTGESEFRPVFFAWFQKPENKLEPPEGWEMRQETAEVKEKAKEHAGVDLTRAQLFWWERRFLRQRRLMDQEHPTVPDDAFITSDRQIFDGVRLKKTNHKTPIREENGWKIYAEPKKGRRYVVGGDPAEGVRNDYSAGAVIDAVTLEEVATFYDNKIKPPAFARRLKFIGEKYNNALIAPERNNHGHTVIDRLKDIYGNIYATKKFDEKRNKKTKKLGWHTNSHTRDLILDNMEDLFNSGTFSPNSAILKNEMTNFITNEDGKREAKSGSHDDAIMATAIALKVASMPTRSFEVHLID